MFRVNPNILITGPPGSGKNRIAEIVSQEVQLRILNINEIAHVNNFVDEYDFRYTLPPVHNKEILNLVKTRLRRGSGNIITYYTPTLFPFDNDEINAVFVIKVDEHILYENLLTRNYDDTLMFKIMNMSYFDATYVEARDIYPKVKVFCLVSNSGFQQQDAVETICDFVRHYRGKMLFELENRARWIHEEEETLEQSQEEENNRRRRMFRD